MRVWTNTVARRIVKGLGRRVKGKVGLVKYNHGLGSRARFNRRELTLVRGLDRRKGDTRTTGAIGANVGKGTAGRRGEIMDVALKNVLISMIRRF